MPIAKEMPPRNRAFIDLTLPELPIFTPAERGAVKKDETRREIGDEGICIKQEANEEIRVRCRFDVTGTVLPILGGGR